MITEHPMRRKSEMDRQRTSCGLLLCAVALVFGGCKNSSQAARATRSARLAMPVLARPTQLLPAKLDNHYMRESRPC